MDQPREDARTMRERMLAGDPYLADDPELEELLGSLCEATVIRQLPGSAG